MLAKHKLHMRNGILCFIYQFCNVVCYELPLNTVHVFFVLVEYEY